MGRILDATLKFDPVEDRWLRLKPARRMARSKLPRKFGRERNASLWQLTVSDDARGIKYRGPLTHNLRTNDGLDWQAGAMADFRAFGAAASAPTSNATATTLTDTGQSWTTDQWKAHAVVFATSTGALGFGVVLSNTGTILTVDGWWRVGNWGASAITGPLTTGFYAILPGAVPEAWSALSTTVQSGAAGDTTLAGEIGGGDGLSRALWTSYTHSAASTSYSNAKTYTATSTKTVNSGAGFTAQNSGRMPFEYAEPNAPTLVSGDTLAQTRTVNF